MRNFLVFIFWYCVLLTLLAAMPALLIASLYTGLSYYELGGMVGQWFGKWLLLIPWFTTFAGWYFGFLPGFKKNQRQIPGKTAERSESESD